MNDLIDTVALKFLRVDPVNVSARVDAEMRSELPADGVAKRLTERRARRSAVRGFLTGIPGGLWSVPLFFIDLRGVFSERANLSAEMHYARDPCFFDETGWWQRVARTAADMPVGAGGSQFARSVVKELVIRRAGPMVAKFSATKVVPVAGGVVGAVWNYAWMKREGARMEREVASVPSP
jgi:hypothetical protein